MYRENIEINKVDRAIHSAGKAFLGFRMEDLLLRTDELDDSIQKEQLIKEYFQNQIGSSDKTIYGTTIRVNAAIKIIKADMVLYALKKITGSTKTAPIAISKAKETIRKIECGELILPQLN